MEVTIGGGRLGSGNKMKAELRNFERSSHDLGYLWKSSMASGTLPVFMNKIGLPGDTFDIDLDADVMTLPTIGPLFGSYKLQLDVFQVPMRLYNAKLHMNALGIGMDMSKVKLPQIEMKGAPLDDYKAGMDLDNLQINSSCIFSYLDIRGLGFDNTTSGGRSDRHFNAVSYLGYWDIYKNYYANKQEEIGVVVHTSLNGDQVVTSGEYFPEDDTSDSITLSLDTTAVSIVFGLGGGMDIVCGGSDVIVIGNVQMNLAGTTVSLYDIFTDVGLTGRTITGRGLKAGYRGQTLAQTSLVYRTGGNTEMELKSFPLANIDQMRENILKHFSDDAFLIQRGNIEPYGLPMERDEQNVSRSSKQHSQEGLAIKTYNSDLFNNWISTEWIDGANGISAVTAVDTSAGNFTIDELNLSKKVYDMLNRIALSGGSYDDWLDAVYTHERQKSTESPVYLGGMMQKLVFQEVVSTGDSTDIEGNTQALGSLAGKGRLTDSKKGGKIVVKIDEPSVIMGLVSLTPNIDYSQGNAWHTNLKTMDDLHKPSLDEIGFQDLITDQMAWFDTDSTGAGVQTFRSAGKQPAWINYMTAVNVTRGTFAEANNQMFMTLNRKYSFVNGRIGDVTTYIDPSKFNDIFAETRLDAQNFWVQIACNIRARRKMSAKIIPNL